MKSDPDVQIDRAVYRDGAWSLTIRCPHCGHLHTHGGGSDPRPEGARTSFLGHRASHCPSLCPSHGSHQRSGGYFLTDPADRIGEAVR